MSTVQPSSLFKIEEGEKLMHETNWNHGEDYYDLHLLVRRI